MASALQPNESGVASYIKGTASGAGTTSGVGVLSSGLPANLLGIWVPGALTAQVVQLWTGTAGNTSTGNLLIGTCTLAANNFYRMPGYFASGIQYYITNENVNLTIFWCPAN